MGNPFVHIELHTGDLAKAKKFYKALFDWKLSDIPQMAYTMLDVGKGTGGGMMKKQMADQPTAWLPYVQVDDVTKSLAKAAKAGAHVVVNTTAIGGNMGEFAVFVDPTGAAVGLWGMAKKAAKKSAKKPAKKAKKKSAKKR